MSKLDQIKEYIQKLPKSSKKAIYAAWLIAVLSWCNSWSREDQIKHFHGWDKQVVDKFDGNLWEVSDQWKHQLYNQSTNTYIWWYYNSFEKIDKYILCIDNDNKKTLFDPKSSNFLDQSFDDITKKADWQIILSENWSKYILNPNFTTKRLMASTKKSK